MEIIDTHLFHPDYDKERKYSSIHTGREELIQQGKLLHFREIDRKLELPPGTARQLVVAVAERYGLRPSLLTDNVVRFEHGDD